MSHELPRIGRRLEPLEAINMGNWVGRDPPAREWFVEDCFLKGTVSILGGDGSAGKSLLLQQLCTASALGMPWLGLNTTRCRSIFISCEDDGDELQRRQHDICRHYCTDLGSLLEDIQIMDRVAADDNTLMQFNPNGSHGVTTPFFTQLSNTVLDWGAQILVLDTAGHVFAGNENNRGQVGRFISKLRRLAIQMQGCIILSSHPSNTGMITGTGASGSTAWNNTVRSRLYLTREKSDSDDDEPSDRRLLKTMKSNYAKGDTRIRLKWEHGVFVTEQQTVGTFSRLEHDQRLYDAAEYLVRNGSMLLADPKGRNSLVSTARETPMCAPMNWVDTLAAQDRLIQSGKLIVVELGPRANRRKFIRPDYLKYPGEI